MCVLRFRLNLWIFELNQNEAIRYFALNSPLSLQEIETKKAGICDTSSNHFWISSKGFIYEMHSLDSPSFGRFFFSFCLKLQDPTGTGLFLETKKKSRQDRPYSRPRWWSLGCKYLIAGASTWTATVWLEWICTPQPPLTSLDGSRLQIASHTHTPVLLWFPPFLFATAANNKSGNEDIMMLPMPRLCTPN